MRKLFILLLGIVFYSCSENERLIYSEGMHDIYYSDVTKDKDSIFVSLLTAEQELTTTINVKLLGDTLRVPEKFKLEVIPEKTTAKEGVHYQKLPETYEFPAGVFEYKMPVTLIKGDEGITKAPVILALRLVPVAGLGIAYENRSVVRLIISDMLRKPEGDAYYEDMGAFVGLFGEYSRKKHTMIIELTGHDFWDLGYGDRPDYNDDYKIYYESGYYTPYARKLYKIITENRIEDENGKVMQGWMVP